jgi:hypothetical protein
MPPMGTDQLLRRNMWNKSPSLSLNGCGAVACHRLEMTGGSMRAARIIGEGMRLKGHRRACPYDNRIPVNFHQIAYATRLSPSAAPISMSMAISICGKKCSSRSFLLLSGIGRVESSVRRR